jgi:pimeloyl-ACP methyl ester carboxylesterase
MTAKKRMSSQILRRRAHSVAPRPLWQTGPTMHTVILVPGMACDGAMWRHQLPALAARHAVHVTDVHFRRDALPDMAAALLAEAPGRVVLVGASMGGMIALEAQRQAPDRVAALALLGSSARADTPELLRLRSDAIGLYAAGRMDDVLLANVAFAFHPIHAARRELVGEYLAMMRRAGADALIRQNRAVMARIDSRPLLGAIRCPLLVACGEADRLVAPEQSGEIAERVPHARLEIVPGAGHMLTMEEPARVNELLLRWLASVPA